MYKINEESSYQSLYSNEDIIESLGEIDVYDEKTKGFVKIEASKIIKVCSDAMYRIQRDYNYLYQFITKCKLMYIPTFPSEITNTMAVDNNCNLWINMSFVYNDCKMKTDYVFGILFHELFHIFFNHILRFQNIYPRSMYASAGDAVYRRANTKANLCMDYEVNASMVDDGIVPADFFKVMNGLYKKEYTGMTWEEIWKKYGDEEYNEWLSRNGMSLDDVEKKVLDAIEEAAKILLDPESDEADKKFARKQLQKKLDEILGRKTDGEKSLQDMFDDLAKTKLADYGDIAIDLDDVSDDLNKDPGNMSAEELDKTLSHMNKLMDDIAENADAVAGDFNKSADEVMQDAEKARQALKDAMKKINEGGLSKDEKKDLIEKAKDALEDIISDEKEKKKLEEKRKERDAKKEAERIEKLKKSHPLRKFIIVMKNLVDLEQIGLIVDKTVNALNDCIDDLEPLTEKRLSEIKKSDLRNISNHLDVLKEALLPDLVKLIEDETILNKTPDDMQKLLDQVFETVFDSFRRIFDPALTEDEKGSLIKMAAQKLRTIGKALKTQKKWRASDDFKEAYKAEMKRLMQIKKDGGDEALMKELLDKGVINPFCLDEKGMELFKKLRGGIFGFDEGDSDAEFVYKPESYTSRFDGEIEPYEGKLYYAVMNYDATGITLELSDEPAALEDHDYEKFGLKFEKDFPDYWIEEEMESIFSVYIAGTTDQPDIDELREKISENPDYVLGEWESMEE